ncbi:MAG: ABC transporter ATP-binding protein [Oscillospiraceae bacterium]|nr:ABC transporter ATP-binding protein [Oscillospiraceae bacterium]
MDKHLLEIKNLKVSFHIGKKKLAAVENVGFSLDRGKIIGIVGESGCGKSVTATSILRLVSPSVCEIDAGSEILFNGEDLSKAPEARMREIRGSEISMIFQEPMSSLNPVYRISDQMMEMLRTHDRTISRQDALARCVEMLRRVGIPSPEQRVKEYPHQLSGGMRQRVMIAMALLCDPKLLIADEPTTALDVTIQAQILRIIRRLTQEMDTAVILITHDMGVIAETADYVMVMYAGKSVEYGTAEDIFDRPMHPYTVGLLSSIPKLGSGQEERLYTIEGTVPGLDEMPEGCRFCTRCPYVEERCRQADPGMRRSGGHLARCWRCGKEEQA